MSIHQVVRAIRESQGALSSFEQVRKAFPDLPLDVIKSAMSQSQNSKDDTPDIPPEALAAGMVKAYAGVKKSGAKSAEEEVEKEVFAMQGTGKETGMNPTLNNTGKGKSQG